MVQLSEYETIKRITKLIQKNEFQGKLDLCNKVFLIHKIVLFISLLYSYFVTISFFSFSFFPFLSHSLTLSSFILFIHSLFIHSLFIHSLHSFSPFILSIRSLSIHTVPAAEYVYAIHSRRK